MKCQLCHKNEATLHLTQVQGNTLQHLDLCGACAETRGIATPQGLLFKSLLKDKAVPEPRSE